MDFDHLPSNIEQGIQHFASQQHISHDEAVIRLIESGLNVIKPEPNIATPADKNVHIRGLPGDPMSDEDAAMMDEIVAEAMDNRRQRWERIMRD